MAIVIPKECLAYARVQQNCEDEYYQGIDVFVAIGRFGPAVAPKNVLDVGSGIGRAVVHMSQLWPQATFWSYDGDGPAVQMAGVSLDLKSSTYYNNAEVTRRYLNANGVQNFRVLQDKPSEHSASWNDLGDAKFDLVTSFRAVGFHWPMSPLFDKLARCVTKDALLVYESKPLTSCKAAYSSKAKSNKGSLLALHDLGVIRGRDDIELLSFNHVHVGRFLRAYIVAQWNLK